MRAKKHLGQNFLNHTAIVRDVVAAANISNEDVVVEIGPGKGALTKELLRYAQKVVVIEKDTELIPLLHEKFEDEVEKQKLEIVEGDAIELFEEVFLKNTPYKVVANIPYYITGQILRTLLTQTHQPISVTLIVQKEVAERIVSRDGKESILSLSVKVYGDPHYIRKIPSRYFTPQPEVDSAVIHIDNISRSCIPHKNFEETFFTLIKNGFAHKRKLLIRNLGALYSKENLSSAFDVCAIDLKSRAETVSLEKWLCLNKTLLD